MLLCQSCKPAKTLTNEKLSESQREILSGSITNEAQSVMSEENKYLKGQGSCKVLIKCNALHEDAQMWIASMKKMNNGKTDYSCRYTLLSFKIYIKIYIIIVKVISIW